MSTHDAPQAQPTPLEQPAPGLWVSYGGEISCTAHLGYSASTLLAERPTLTVLHGATDVWHTMTDDEAAQMRALGFEPECEGCRFRA